MLKFHSLCDLLFEEIHEIVSFIPQMIDIGYTLKHLLGYIQYYNMLFRLYAKRFAQKNKNKRF